MARKRGAKLKQEIKKDEFRDFVLKVGRWIKKNVFFFAALCAVVVLFSYAVYRRVRSASARKERVSTALIEPEAVRSVEAWRKLLEDNEGTPQEAMFRMHLARALWEKHREKVFEENDRSLLRQAAEQLRIIVQRYKDSGTPYFYAVRQLPKVEAELKAEYPWLAGKKKTAEAAPPKGGSGSDDR